MPFQLSFTPTAAAPADKFVAFGKMLMFALKIGTRLSAWYRAAVDIPPET